MKSYKIVYNLGVISGPDKSFIKNNFEKYKKAVDALEKDIQNALTEGKAFYPFIDEYGRRYKGLFCKTKYLDVSIRAVFKIDHKNKIVEIRDLVPLPRD